MDNRGGQDAASASRSWSSSSCRPAKVVGAALSAFALPGAFGGCGQWPVRAEVEAMNALDDLRDDSAAAGRDRFSLGE